MTTLDEEASLAAVMTEVSSSKPRPVVRTVVANSVANVTRLGFTSLVAILLPAYLTHRLPIKTYGAWVLILQLGAYVGYLDFGFQAAVAKYIAEYETKRDYVGCGASASAGLVITILAGVLGVLLSLILAWRVPGIFRTMPSSLYHDVRLSVIFVGVSLSVSLATSAIAAIFLGLQRYQIPMALTIISRLLFALVIWAAVALHSSLAVMGAAAACVNLITGLLQIVAWRRIANHIRLSLRSIDVMMLKRMLRYCAVLGVWSVCTLFISGLDLTIVGHYSFSETAYYAIANSPTTFILMIIAALMGPLFPAASALSAQRSSAQMGAVLLRATRYATITTLLTGLPLLIAGYVILRLWVGPVYALHSLRFLRILVLANIVRQLCSPYNTMVVATARQWVATASPVTEGIVNLASSIWLVQHQGALGVALGTLLGAVVGVAMHFGMSMRYTQANLRISRAELFVKGMLRPIAIAIPSVLLVWRWWPTGMPSMSPQLYGGWIISTLLLVWYVGMSREDRDLIARLVNGKINPFQERT